jgi:hypothetical protein
MLELARPVRASKARTLPRGASTLTLSAIADPTTTAPRLTLHGVDTDRGLRLIKGAGPGPSGGLVLVRSAAKTPLLRGGIPVKGDVK